MTDTMTDCETRLRCDLDALATERAAATTDKERGRILGKMVDICWQYERVHGEYSSSEMFAAAYSGAANDAALAQQEEQDDFRGTPG